MTATERAEGGETGSCEMPEGDEGRDGSLDHVDQGDRNGQPPALQAEDVGRSGRPASERPDVLPGRPLEE